MPEIISRKEARALGLKRYFTGKPCPKGHISERIVHHADCLECRSKYERKKREKRPRRYRTKQRGILKDRGIAAVRALVELGIDIGVPAVVREPIGASSRSEALRLGVYRYFTGKPCIHGHISSRTICSGCDECQRESKRRRIRYQKKPGSGRIQKKRSRERRRAAVRALMELGIEI